MAFAAKIDLDQLMNQLRIELTGASDAGLKGAFYEVCNEFFSDSSSWLEDIPISVITSTVAYDLVPGDGGRIIRLAGVVDPNGIPQQVLMPVIGQVRLRYPQNTAQIWTATVAKTVSFPTTKEQFPIIPDWTLQVFREAILSGVMGRLMRQPNKSYSDKTNSVYHLQRFRKGITDARVATMRRNTLGSQAWSFPQGFRTRSQKSGISVGNATRF